MLRLPQELCPAMPPSVACARVETSTGYHRPCGLSWALRWSSTLPGSTNWATLGELKAYGTPVGAAPLSPGGGNRGGAVDNSDCEKRTPFGDCIISNVKTVPTNR